MKIRNASLAVVCGPTSSLPDTGCPQVAFAGKSNVGKSSLINALMNRKNLARTSSQPGKTRTINYYLVDFLGPAETAGEGQPAEELPMQVYLTDLPGYGYAQVSQEIRESWGKMTERYLRQSEDLRQVFLLVDIRHEPSANDRQMYEWIRAQGWTPVVLAAKQDKIRRSQRQKQLKVIREGLQMEKGSRIIAFSSETKEGIDEIWQVIMEAAAEAEENR